MANGNIIIIIIITVCIILSDLQMATWACLFLYINSKTVVEVDTITL